MPGATQKQEIVWFVIMNAEEKLDNLNTDNEASGKNLDYFRTQQDNLLQSFVQKWGTLKDQPARLKPNPTRSNKTSYSEIVKQLGVAESKYELCDRLKLGALRALKRH